MPGRTKETDMMLNETEVVDMPTVEKTLTPQEAGQVLQLHAKTVIRFAEAGKIPGKKFGNRWRFVRSVLEAYLRGEVVTYTGRP
jgi:excisionase family DNA binding protein